MTAYYNENDPFAAAWLRNLIAAGHITAGEVDERSIEEIAADDLEGFDRCHFFAGIAGWDLALQFAGWGDSAKRQLRPTAPSGLSQGRDPRWSGRTD